MKKTISIREPELSDQDAFILATRASETFHQPWTKAPTTAEEFQKFYSRCQQDNSKSYFVCDENDSIAGVFNLNEIVRGCFQNAYLGFYVIESHAGKGYMSAGLKLLLQQAFTELGLHRIEANIQPENTSSICLVSANKFRKEGYSPRYLKINDVWRDHERWAITSEEWLGVSLHC